MFKHTKRILHVLAIFALAFVLTACGTKDSKGKVFKASLNHNQVMLDPSYNAKVELKTNKNSTYKVLDSNGKEVQKEKKTKTGKATLNFTEKGNYEVVATSDNKHVTKKLALKVKELKKNVNKDMTAVGPMKFTVKNVKYQKMTKTKEPHDDAEYNIDNYKALNKHYYKVTIGYTMTNTGKTKIDPTITLWSPVDDNNVEYSSASNDAYSFDTIVGGSSIQPKMKKSGQITMISNDKFSVEHLKISVSEQYASNDKQIGDGGVAELK